MRTKIRNFIKRFSKIAGPASLILGLGATVAEWISKRNEEEEIITEVLKRLKSN